MKQTFVRLRQVAFVLLFSTSLLAQTKAIKPISPNASPEAVALLNYFYSISGKYTLTGQHNYPATQNKNTEFVKNYIGKTPVIYSVDFGFSKDGDKDCYLARPEIVKEAIRQHQLGSIITICWHAAPPTANEPVTFQPVAGANPDLVQSVQGKLTNEQLKDILTPGTALYKHWCVQVDTIARYLKMLQVAHVPVIWRPYHEMNGDWFWWGARIGKYSTMGLYKQIYDRLTRVHKLNNLIWVWSVDRPRNEMGQFKNYFPGTKYVDILGLDVYGNDFNQSYYDQLKALSGGKLLTLAEVGNPPSAEAMEHQPDWVYYVVWAGMVRNTPLKQYQSLSQNKQVVYMDDKSYVESSAAYRQRCNLAPLKLEAPKPANFTGTYIFNEDKSTLNNNGAADLPYRISILQQGNSLKIQKMNLVEFGDNSIETLKLALDGSEIATKVENVPVNIIAKIIDSSTFGITAKTRLTNNGKTTELLSIEKWYLTDNGKSLVIEQNSNTPWGEKKLKMIFDKAMQ